MIERVEKESKDTEMSFFSFFYFFLTHGECMRVLFASIRSVRTYRE